MARSGWVVAASAVVVAGVLACSSGSGGPGGTSSDAGHDGGGSGGSGSGSSSGGSTAEVTYSCASGSGTSATCTQQQVPASLLMSTDQACTQGGGTPGTSCPAAGLAGCCAISGILACYYDATTASSIQMSCVSEGGTWSTTP